MSRNRKWTGHVPVVWYPSPSTIVIGESLFIDLINKPLTDPDHCSSHDQDYCTYHFNILMSVTASRSPGCFCIFQTLIQLRSTHLRIFLFRPESDAWKSDKNYQKENLKQSFPDDVYRSSTSRRLSFPNPLRHIFYRASR